MSKKRVVGVSYTEGEAAPVVVVKGSGEAAEAVLSQARGRDAVPIVRDPDLVAQLYRVPVDGEVGRDLFPVMAALLAHVLLIDRNRRESSK
jgi:flagellar biosynthesis protein